MTLAYHTIASDFTLDNVATSRAGVQKLKSVKKYKIFATDQFALKISLTVLQHLVESIRT